MTTSDITTSDLEWSKAGAHLYDDVITARFAVYHHHIVEPYLDHLAATGVRRVLDVGCGTGLVSLALAERGMDVTALDHSPYMLEVVERKALERGLDRQISFVRGDATALPFDDASFDAVTCQRMLHHLPAHERVIVEIVRVTRERGFVYLCEPTTMQTPIKRLIIRPRRRIRAAIHRRGTERNAPMLRARDEGPIDAEHLAGVLEDARLRSHAIYFTQIGQHRHLSERVRWTLIQTLSWPWRRSCGDLLFVFAEKH